MDRWIKGWMDKVALNSFSRHQSKQAEIAALITLRPLPFLPYFASSSPTLRPPPLRVHAGLRKPLCNTVTQRSAQPCVPPPTELLIATSFMALMATTSSVSPPSHGEWLHFKASSKQPSFSFLQVITLHCSSVFVTVSATVRWKKQTDGRDLFFLSYIRVDVFVCCPSHGLPAADNQARDHTEMEVNCV